MSFRDRILVFDNEKWNILCIFLTLKTWKCWCHILCSLSSCWFCTFNTITKQRKKLTSISIWRDTMIVFFKPVQLIGLWDNTKYFMNWNIHIFEGISNIHNSVGEYMHSFYSNVYYEWIYMFHWNIRLIIFILFENFHFNSSVQKLAMHLNRKIILSLDKWVIRIKNPHQVRILWGWELVEGWNYCCYHIEQIKPLSKV